MRLNTLLIACLCLSNQAICYADRQSDHKATQQRKEALNQIIDQRLEQKRLWEQQQKLKAAAFAQGQTNPYTKTVTVKHPHQIDSQEPLRVYLYTWPTQPMQPPEARIFTDPTDHLYIDWLELKRAHFTLRTEPIEHYLQTQSKAPGELLLQKQGSNNTIGYSILGFHEFLREVSPEAVQGYVEGLRLKYGEQIQIHNEWDYQPHAGFPAFGGQWLYVDYTITPNPDPSDKPQTDSPLTPTTHRDYFIDLGDGIAVIRIQSLPAMFDLTVQAVEKSLRKSLRL